MNKQPGPPWSTLVGIVGLALALALWSGLSRVAASNDKLADVVANKLFHSSGSTFNANNAEGVIPLSNDRFAVVRDFSISVYQVDAQGKVQRMDDVDPRLEPMRRRQRYKKYGNE